METQYIHFARIDALTKAETIALRSMIWHTHGLRLRYICRGREACTYALKRHTSKRHKLLGADNVLARFQRVSEALYWAKVYNVKKGK